MTQPIQEPSTARNFSRSTWNENQLYRRPPPAAPFVPTVFRARQTTNFNTLGSGGTEVRLTFDQWENGDITVFDPQLDGSGFLESVILQDPPGAGVYSLVCMVSVQSLGAAAGSQIVILMNDNFDSPTQVVYPRQVAGSGGDYLYSDLRTYPPFMPDNPGDPVISFDAAQSGGTDRDTQYGTMMEIVYLGPFRSEQAS